MNNGKGREDLILTPRSARWPSWHVRSMALALAVGFLLCAGGGRVWAQAVPNGAVNGLVPRFVDVDGLHTRYYRAGHGEPLVLIHGGRSGGVSNSANVWSKNIRPLSRRFEVLAPDRPGHGLTEGTLAQSKDYEFQVNWLYHFILAMKLGRVNLVGHSSGGAIAFFFAVAHPEMVKTLVVIASGPEIPGIFSHPQRLESLLKTCAPATTYQAWKCRVGLLSYAPQIAFSDPFLEAERAMYSYRENHLGPSYRTTPKHKPGQLPKPAPQFFTYRKASLERARAGALGAMPVMIYYGKQDPLDWYAGEKTAQLSGAMAFFDVLGAKDPNVSLKVLNHAGHFVYRVHPRQFDNDLTSFIGFWDQHMSTTK
jgi:2-hydroxy-6-oxonona-2,4-dienedioate hydrolase